MARKGHMYEKEITSQYLNESISLRIYEPEKIDSLYETNVCIMQDGNDYYNLGRLATVSDELHENDTIVNTIFVGIHYKDRFERRERYHPEGKEHEAYMNFLIDEVVNSLDEIIPLNPLGIKYSLMGDSLAGTLALLAAIKHPHLFENIIIQSPLVTDEMLKLINKAEKIDQLTIYHTIGLKETNVKTTVDGEVEFVQPNQSLSNLLKDKIRFYHYYEFPDGQHTWKYWQEDLSRALTTILV